MARDSHKTDGTEPLDAPQSLVGRAMGGQFRLKEVINVGGMGIIFRAIQLNTDRTVAVKVLKPTHDEDVNLMRRFKRESKILGRLSHPNIVSLIDAGRDAGGVMYLAMEYVKGATFRQVLRNKSLTIEEIVDVFAKAASGLAEAHAKDVIHRDLKLENIMIGRQVDGYLRVTLLDFGVAKPIADRSEFELTQQGQVPGTPATLAPELIQERPPSPRSDLYSLGVLLFTVLSGAPPYQADNEYELMRLHIDEPIPDLAANVPGWLPDSLVELTVQLMDKTPSRRPQDAVEVRDRLESVRRQLWRQGDGQRDYQPGPDDGDTTQKVDRQALGGEVSLEDAFGGDEDGGTDEDSGGGPLQGLMRAIFGSEPLNAPVYVVVLLGGLFVALVAVLVYLIVPGWAGI